MFIYNLIRTECPLRGRTLNVVPLGFRCISLFILSPFGRW